MKYLLGLLFLLVPSGVKDVPMAHNVQFAYTKNRTLSPMLPIEINVDQEEGGIPDTFLTCDVNNRSLENGTKQYVIVLKCKDKVFRVTAISFTESK